MFNHPSRTVTNNVLHSADLPDIRIQVDSAFTYAGHIEIILGNAAADLHFFVDADPETKHLKRMIKLQFEGFLPDIDKSYTYTIPDTIELGRHYYMHNPGAYRTSDVVRERPKGDIAHGNHFLCEQGYTGLDENIFIRFVRMIGEEKRHEFIIVYAENLRDTDYVLEDLSPNGKAAAEVEVLAADLLQRACNSFTIIEG